MVAVHASLSVLLPLRPMHFGHRAAPPPAHHAALAAEGEARGADELFVLAIGDWGGIGVYPYVTPAQLAVRDAMAAAARGSSAGKKLVLAVGDNFYFTGVASAADPRFQQTFEDVYVTGYPELSEKDMWRLVAGNRTSASPHLARLRAPRASPSAQARAVARVAHRSLPARRPRAQTTTTARARSPRSSRTATPRPRGTSRRPTTRSRSRSPAGARARTS
jgi:hypothetical protein